jgi:hypothetical protein
MKSLKWKNEVVEMKCADNIISLPDLIWSSYPENEAGEEWKFYCSSLEAKLERESKETVLVSRFAGSIETMLKTRLIDPYRQKLSVHEPTTYFEGINRQCFVPKKRLSEEQHVETLDRKADSDSVKKTRLEVNLAIWKEQVEYYESSKEKIWQVEKYRNKYIAIMNKKIIDFDGDKFILARRVKKLHPEEVVLIKEIKQKEDVVRMRSPRVTP